MHLPAPKIKIFESIEFNQIRQVVGRRTLQIQCEDLEVAQAGYPGEEGEYPYHAVVEFTTWRSTNLEIRD